MMNQILLEQSRDLKTLISFEQARALRESGTGGAAAAVADSYAASRAAERAAYEAGAKAAQDAAATKNGGR